MVERRSGQGSLPVSVVLPTYNRGAVLPRAIRSVLAQTHSPLELIVVDDASTEDIATVVGSFVDPRVRYERLPGRSGTAAARNRGVELAKGDWIAFQDSDDEWLINKLERQWAAAEQGTTEAGLVCSGYIIVPRSGRPTLVGPTRQMRQRSWSAEARFAFPFIAPTWLVRRSAFLGVGGFDTALPNLEDWELSFRLHDHGGFVALTEALLVKHGSADGLNQDSTKQIRSLELIRAKHAALLNQSPRIKAELALRCARFHAQTGDGTSARRNLAEAFQSEWSFATGLLYGTSFLPLPVLRRLQRRLRNTPAHEWR